MKRELVKGLVVLVAIAAVTAADADSGGPADSSAGSDAAQLGTVTVTARQREESAQDVPLPVTVIDGNSLERSGSFRIESLQQDLPSTYIEFNSPRQTSISVRGIGNNAVNEALEPDVGVYLDDVYLSHPGMANVDLLDIDKVELDEGPQGTLYGKNTNAGILKISTRAPSFTPESMAEFSGGSDQFYQARAMFSGPLAEDLAGRIAFARTWQGGYVDDITDGRELNGSDRGGVRGQLLYKPTSELSFRLIGDYNYEHSNCCTPVPYSFGVPFQFPFPPPNGPLITTTQYQLGAMLAGANPMPVLDTGYRTVTSDGPQHEDVRQGGASLQATWQHQGYELTSITAYRSWAYYPINDADMTSVNAETFGQNVDAKQFTQELRLSSSPQQRVSYVTGLYYFFQNQNNLGFQQFGPDADKFLLYVLATPPKGLPQPSADNAYVQVFSTPTTDSAAAYGQVSWKIDPQWDLNAGLRETFEDKSSRIVLPTIQNNPVSDIYQPPYDSGPLRMDTWNLSALLSLDYHYSRNLMLYASTSRGSKSGGINSNIPPYALGGSYDTNALYVSPERAYDAEMGFKSTAWDRRVMLNMDVYWMLLKDYQAALLQQVSAGQYSATLENVGPVRGQGVEGQLTVLPAHGLKLNLTASYNDTLYRDYQNAPCPAGPLVAFGTPTLPCNLTGSQVNGAPRWNVNPSVEYSHLLGERFRGYVLTNYSWRSSFFGTPDDASEGRVAAYGIANLRVGVHRPFGESNWDVSAFATNLFDKHYVVGNISPAQFGAYFEYPGAPRIVGATLRASF